MALPLVPAIIGASMALVGLGVLVARPERRISVLLAALLVLWGAATATAGIYPAADDAAHARTLAHLSVWYALPLPLLLALLVPVAIAPRPPRLAGRIALAALATITLAGIAAMFLAPELYVASLARIAGRHAITSGPLYYVLAAVGVAAQATIVLAAVLAVRDDATPPLAKDRARTLGIALAIVPLHAGAFFLAFILAGTPSVAIPLFWARALPTLAAGAVALAGLLALRAHGPPATRTAALALVLGIGALGLLDGFVGARRLLGEAYPGYETSQAVVRLALALLLAIATLRYGLADSGARARRALARLATGIVAALVAAGTFALGNAAVGDAPLAIGAASVLAIAAPAALRRPLARAGHAAADHILLAREDPRAVAERARTYTSALAAARRPDGTLHAEGERLLADLRLDLGIGEQEHELLLRGLASRDAERYHRVEPLGRGATADVDLARDETGRRVVVKRFHAIRDPAAALAEARALASVKHPRIVPFLEVDRRDDELRLVLAYAEGGSARALLDREGPLAPTRAIALVCDLLDGLDALHARGLIHCDVKAENLLLDREGRGLLGDFGSARFVADDPADATLVPGQAEGSLSTMSPESLRGHPPAPTRDVYAAGAVLYRLLTGEHYVELAGASPFEARQRITLDAPRLPHPHVPAHLEPVLRRALAKRPEERHPDARALREAIEAAQRAHAPPPERL